MDPIILFVLHSVGLTSYQSTNHLSCLKDHLGLAYEELQHLQVKDLLVALAEQVVLKLQRHLTYRFEES